MRGKSKDNGTLAGTLKGKRLLWRPGNRRKENKTNLNDVLFKDQKIVTVIMVLGAAVGRLFETIQISEGAGNFYHISVSSCIFGLK